MVFPLPTVTQVAPRRFRVAGGLRALAASDWALAVADQILVSGASFAATLLIGRTASAALGEYALAVSVVATVLALQNALVLLPYTIRRHRADAEEAADAGEALALSGLLSLAAAAACLVVAAALAGAGAGSAAALTATLGAAMPFLLLREFARRCALARLRMRAVLALDVAAAGMQLAGLAALAPSHTLGATGACAVLGLSCAIPALVWTAAGRREIAWPVRELSRAAERSWALGKWLLLGQLTVQVQSYCAYWLSGFIAGATVTGVYAACMSIIGFANPVVFGIGNVMTPKLAQAWQRGGGEGIRREAAKNALLLGSLMALFCLLVGAFGESLMELLLPGHEYQDHGAVLMVLAFAMLATATGMPASNALASMERPRAIVIVGGLGAAVTVALVGVLMTEYGLVGAAYGFLIGSIVGALGRWVAFLAVARNAHELPPPAHVLHRLAGATGEIVRLGGGDQASVYAVATGAEPVVAKIYRRDSAPAMAQAEFAALAAMARALDGRMAAGWTMRVPRPLTLSHAPLALAMTRVPGRPLETWAAAAGPALLEQAGEAFAEGLAALWASGGKHGDLGLRNVLFDLDTRSIALLDPGTLASCPVCHRGGFSAAALDLGHLVAELTTDVNDLVGAPLARACKQTFVAAVLRAAVRASGDGLRDEIRAALAAHLDAALTPSVSPRGIWNRLIRPIAERRIADLFAGIPDRRGRGA